MSPVPPAFFVIAIQVATLTVRTTTTLKTKNHFNLCGDMSKMGN
jgi:hypothetical protein